MRNVLILHFWWKFCNMDNESEGADDGHCGKDEACSASKETVISPVLNREKLKSKLGILRIIQMVLCISAFIIVHTSPTCGWSLNIEHRHRHIWLCKGLNAVAFRIFLAGTMLVFLTTLVAHGFFITNLTDIVDTIPWDKLIFIHTGMSILVMILLFVVLAADDYSSTEVTISMVLVFLAAIAFIVQFSWQVFSKKTNTLNAIFTQRKGDGCSSTVVLEFDNVDCSQEDNVSIEAIPTLCVVRKKADSMESLEIPCDSAVQPVSEFKASVGTNDNLGSSSDSSSQDKSLKLSFSRCSSESEDGRSFVVTQSSHNLHTNTTEDTLSTGTYTVEA